MMFEHIDDAAESDRVGDVRYSVAIKGLPAISVRLIAKTIQQLTVDEEVLSLLNHTPPTPAADVQQLPEKFCFVCIDFAMLLEWCNLTSRPKTASTTYNFWEQSSEDVVKKEDISPDNALLNTVIFYFKPRETTVSQLELLRFLHRAFSRLLYYSTYCLINARMEQREHEMSYTRRRIKDSKTFVETLDETDANTVLSFWSRFVEKCDLEQVSGFQASPIVSSFLKGERLGHFLPFRNASFYDGLCYWSSRSAIPTHVHYTTVIRNNVIKRNGIKNLPFEAEVEPAAG